MIQVNERLSEAAAHAATLTLRFDARQKSRLRTMLDDGTEAALMLPRGTVLRDGDLLRADSGLVILVVAAAEGVSEVVCDDAVQLARACYHLGNRHVPLQIGAGFARYLHDHVLDDMVRGLGLTVRFAERPFEPEGGAYHGHAGHGHDDHHHDTHGHDHAH